MKGITEMETKKANRTLDLVEALDIPERHLLAAENVKESVKKEFRYVNSDMKLLEIAQSDVGFISDCFILYAVCHFGVATRENIQLFLEALHKKFPDLSISQDGLEMRLRKLYKSGYIFRISYILPVQNEKKEVCLYTPSEDAHNLVQQTLQKKVPLNCMIQAKPITELIGWACAAYAGACIAQNSAFLEFTERTLHTKQIGSVYLPSEIKTRVDGEFYYVGVIASFTRHFDSTYQTPLDYEKNCVRKVNIINNYLNCRTQKGTAVVVAVVEDKEDLRRLTSHIYAAYKKTGLFRNALQRIFFTGEGILREHLGNALHAFLGMKEDPEKESGYVLTAVSADFLAY